MPNKFFQTYKWHFGLVLIACALLLSMEVLLGLSRQGVLYPDCASYVESAKNLYVFKRGHNYRPMLLAAIQGFPYLFGSSDTTLIGINRFLNFGCWIASVLLLFEILKTFLSVRISFWLCVLCVLLVGMPAMAFHLLSESVFLVFAMAAVYWLFRYFSTRRPVFLCASVSIFLASMLIRPGVKFFAIVLCLWFCRELWRMRKSKAFYFIYAALLMIFIQCAGVLYQFGNFTISYIDAVTYYDYLGSKALGIPIDQKGGQAKNPRNAYIYSLPCPEQKIVAAQDFKKQLLENPDGLAMAYAKNLWGNSTSGNIILEDSKNLEASPVFASAKSIFTAAAQWQNLLFTVLGLLVAPFFLFKKTAFQAVSVLILYTIVLSAISSEQGDRFHIATFPFTIILLGALFFREKGYTVR